MALRQAAAVARSEIRYLTRTGALWKLTGLYTAAVTVTLLLAWPSRQALAVSAPPATLRWVFTVQLAALAYISLALAADGIAWGDADHPRPVHWVAYGACPPWAAVVGRLLALWYVQAYLAAAAVPLTVLAYGASPVTAGVLGLSGAIAFIALSVAGLAGLWMGGLSPTRSTRLVAVDALYLCGAMFVFLTSGPGAGPADGIVFYLNPFNMATLLMERGALYGEARSISWPVWLGLYAALALAAGGLAVRSLRSWRRQPPPPGGSRPRDPAGDPTEGAL